MGDFRKLGLLRALQTASLCIGLNWYLVLVETRGTLFSDCLDLRL